MKNLLGDFIGATDVVDDPLAEAVLHEMESQSRHGAFYRQNGYEHEEQDDLTLEEIEKANQERVKFLCQEIRIRCHREEIYRDDFLFRMFDVIIYPEGEHGPGYKFWWMSQGHPIVQWIWENFALSDRRPDVVVPVQGWGTALIYSNDAVQMAVDQIVEKCREYGNDIIELEEVDEEDSISSLGEQQTEPVIMQEVDMTEEQPTKDELSNSGVIGDTTNEQHKVYDNGIVEPKPSLITIPKPAYMKKGE